MICKRCEVTIPHTKMTRKHRLCTDCRHNRPWQQEWGVIWQSNADGLFHGTDLTEGSMDWVGACNSVDEVLRRLGLSTLAPQSWDDWHGIGESGRLEQPELPVLQAEFACDGWGAGR